MKALKMKKRSGKKRVVKRWIMAVGIVFAALAIATICRPTMLPAALFIVFDAWRQPRGSRIAFSTLAVVASIGMLGLYANWEIHGSLLGGRAEVVATIAETHAVPSYFSFSVTGLVGLLISPSRGLFVFSPVLLFALPGMSRCLRAPTEPSLRLMTLAGLSTYFLYGFIATWWGGWVYGPRYMTDLIPFFALWLAICPQPRRGRVVWGLLFGVAFAWSVWVQHLGASRYPCFWSF